MSLYDRMVFSTGKTTECEFEEVSSKLTEFSLHEAEGPDYNPKCITVKASFNDGASHQGKLIFSMNWGRAQIDLMFVDKDHRGHGIGKMMVKMAEDFARNAGCAGIDVWTPTWQGEGFYDGECGYTEKARVKLNVPNHFEGQPQYNIFFSKDFF